MQRAGGTEPLSVCVQHVWIKASPKGGICLVWTSLSEKLSAPRVLSYSLV